MISGGRAQRAGEQRLLLVAARQRQDRLVHIGRADADPVAPVLRRRPARGRGPAACRSGTAAASRWRCSRQSTTAERCRRSAGRRRPAPRRPELRCLRAWSKTRTSNSVWPCPLSPASPTTSPLCADKRHRCRPWSRAGPSTHERARSPAWPRHPLPARAALGNAAHRRDQRLAVERSGAVQRHDPAVAHHRDPVRGLQDLAQQMRDQHAGSARRRHSGAHGPAVFPPTTRVQRRGRFVQDDHPRRAVGDRKGARDLDHLSLSDRQVADHVIGGNPVPREHLIQHPADQVTRARAASRCR